MGRKLELIGRKFGRLTVVKEVGKDKKNGCILWECICECGKDVNVTSSSLKSGHSKSCGCLWIYNIKKANTKHGMNNSCSFYNSWAGMKNRCNNSKSLRYENYGGRGIKHQESWSLFENFKNDMYESYLKHAEKHGEKQTTLERLNVDGDYTKENCTWKTNLEQQNNKRNNKIIVYNGESITLSDLARKYNIGTTVLNGRLLLGWGIEKALTTPIRAKRK